MCADGIEVAKQDCTEVRMGGAVISEDPFDHHLSPAIGAGGLDGRHLFLVRMGIVRAVNSGRGGENQFAASELLHRFYKGQCAVQVVAVILQRFLDTLTYCLEAGEMDHGINVVFSEDFPELFLIRTVHPVESNTFSSDFLDAVDRIVGGLERKSKIITPQEKKSIAHHEAGHATVSWLLPNANPLFKVTIVPRGQALGAAWYLPEERQLVTREQMLDEMCSLIGGRVAEEIVNGQPSTGALNDLERLTKMAYSMVMYYGMSDKVGTLSFYDSTGARGYDLTKPYSEKTAELIDKEVKELVEMIHDRTESILKENFDGFTQLAELLLEKEVIFADDLERIFGPRAGARPGEEVRKDPEEIATEE